MPLHRRKRRRLWTRRRILGNDRERYRDVQHPDLDAPGPNGIEPSISLSYDSQGGNGLLGVGWNLDAVTSIERCPRTMYQDGVENAVNLTAADKFCIKGNRLRARTGTYGAAGTIYFTEMADYSRITSSGSAGTGPDHFVVEGKNGLTYEYGNTVNSRVFVVGNTTVLRWMLNKVYDRNGNSYVITYVNETGFAVPDTISWTPTTLNSSSYVYQAKFEYYTTRANEDSYLGKAFIYDAINHKRLTDIQIKSNGTVIRKYRLSYDTSTVTQRSRLTSFKECADDAETNCKLPLTFGYQTGVAGVTAGTGTTPPGSSSQLIAGRYDLNGDGKDDIVYWTGTAWTALLSANTGFSGPYATGATTAVLIDRFLPNGRSSLIASSGGTLWSYRWDTSSSSFAATNLGITSGAPTAALDYNGDGLADLVYMPSNANFLQVRPNTSTGNGAPSFSSTAYTTATLTGNKIYGNLYSYTGKGLYRADINGDGRQDLNVLTVTTGIGGGSTSATILLGSSTGFDVSTNASDWIAGGAPIWPAVNFNDDHCTDRFVNSTVVISSCNGVPGTNVAAPGFPIALLDWNGDGRTDLLVNTGGTIGIYLSNGSGFSSLIPTSIPSTGILFDVDQDGDGLDDLVKINGTSAFSYWTHTASGSAPPTFATNIPDLLTTIADGYGVTHTLNYASTSFYYYDSGTVTSWPLQEAAPAIVIAQTASSDGIGGTFNKTYSYSGARFNPARGEFAGYQHIDETDSRNGLISRRSYEQSFPLTGMLKAVDLLQANGSSAISHTDFHNTYAFPDGSLDNVLYNERYFPYSDIITTTNYEVGGNYDGHLLRTITVNDSYDYPTGTLYDHKTTTDEPVTGANGVTGGGSWVEETKLPLANLLSVSASWCNGRPQVVQQINSHNLTTSTFGSQITRTENLTWDTSACRPTQMVSEPGDSALQITTNLHYDSYGNIDSSTATGINMSGRMTSTTYTDGTHTTGQFPLSVTNALGEQSSMTWDYNLGVPLSAKDPNNLTISWQYDPYGRVTREDRPDSTHSTFSISACSSCDPRLHAVREADEFASGASIPYRTAFTYTDLFDRVITVKESRNDSAYNVQTRDLDALGRTIHDYFPYLSTGSNVGYLTTDYDVLGRPTAITRPSANPATIVYEGLKTTVTDPQGMKTYKVANAIGQLKHSEDHNHHYQEFDYDAFGNLARVTDDTSGAPLQTSVYDNRGGLTSRTDMDMGTWVYKLDALGEVTNIRDAKTSSPAWTQSLVYDALGRVTERDDLTVPNYFTWGALSDNSPANKYVGQLKSMSGPGYTETYAYDQFARPLTTTISADATYSIDYSYNTMGSIDTLTYPTSTSSYRLKLQYDYQNGFLYRIKDANASNTIFWTANSFNTRDQVTQESVGNVLTTNLDFDAVTGWLKSIQSGVGTSTSVQNLVYTWDQVGNLSSRKDKNQSDLLETFTYDNLYRLSMSSLSTTGQNLSMAYDALGNITNKSGVGAYTYDGTKKHQVASTSNGWSFAYDANGNMTSGRGNTITWTSYNYPSCITSGTDCTGTSANYSAFSYTPDRRYWKQTSNYLSGGDATTIYVGGLMEKVTTSSGIDYRHYISAGNSTVVISRQSNGTNNTYYVTTDHLGSSDVITDINGAVVTDSATHTIPARESFDAFGRRRGSNWAGSAGYGGVIAGITRTGFTGQEALDNLELVHMNGRVQDPLLGRFLSADPFVFNSLSTQGYNRYSYVENNPLSAIDPSGFQIVVGDGRRIPPGRDHYNSPGDISRHQHWDPIESDFFNLSDLQFNVTLPLQNGSENGFSETVRRDPQLSGVTPTNSIAGTNWEACKRIVPLIRPNDKSLRRAISADRAYGEILRHSPEEPMQPLFEEAFYFVAAGEVTDALRFGRALGIGVKDVGGQVLTPLLKKYLEGSGGRWGSRATRALNDRLATMLKDSGLEITGGAGRAAEEYIPGPGGKTLGSTFVDITAKLGSRTVRVQTVDTLADGITLTAREAAAAKRIEEMFPNDILLLIAK